VIALIEEIGPDGLSKRFWRFTCDGTRIYLSSAGRCERKTTRHKWVDCLGNYVVWSSRVLAPTVPRSVFDQARAALAASIPTTIHNAEIDEVTP
jgi:hypothetical protein